MHVSTVPVPDCVVVQVLFMLPLPVDRTVESDANPSPAMSSSPPKMVFIMATHYPDRRAPNPGPTRARR